MNFLHQTRDAFEIVDTTFRGCADLARVMPAGPGGPASVHGLPDRKNRDRAERKKHSHYLHAIKALAENDEREDIPDELTRILLLQQAAFTLDDVGAEAKGIAICAGEPGHTFCK